MVFTPASLPALATLKAQQVEMSQAPDLCGAIDKAESEFVRARQLGRPSATIERTLT